MLVKIVPRNNHIHLRYNRVGKSLPNASALVIVALALAAAACDDASPPGPRPDRADTLGVAIIDAGAAEVPGDGASPVDDTGPDTTVQPDVPGPDIDHPGTVGAEPPASSVTPPDADAGDASDAADGPDRTDTSDGSAGLDGDSGGDGDGADGADPVLDLKLLAAGHLQLWLQGPRGVDCTVRDGVGRVDAWRDQSGNGRDAKPVTGTRGPLCGASAGAINELPVVGFPATADQHQDEVLEVDLKWMAKKPFTIAIVEKRSIANRNGSWMLGSRLPYANDSCDEGLENPNNGHAFRFGYHGPRALMASTWGESCDLRVAVPPPVPPFAVPPVPPMPMKPRLSVLTYAPEVGFTLFVDGAAGTSKVVPELVDIGIGLIGLGYEQREGADYAELRYQGDIAEIAGFDVSLTDAQRGSLQAYLKKTWATGP
jgi:hypothetical protein